MNHHNRTIHEIMTPFEKLFMLEEKEVIDEKVIQQVSDKEYSFILVYRKERQNIIGYVKTKEVILRYLQFTQEGKRAKHQISQLVKTQMSTHLTRVHQDAVAIEALHILQHYRTKLLLVCSSQRHQSGIETPHSSAIDVYKVQPSVLSLRSGWPLPKAK